MLGVRPEFAAVSNAIQNGSRSDMAGFLGNACLSFERALAEALAGAKRSGKLEIGLEAAVHLDGGVAGADDALADAPGSNSGDPSPEEEIEAFYGTEVKAHESEPAAAGIEIRGQIMESGKRFEVLLGDAAVFHAGSGQHPVRDRLGSYSCQHRAPVVQAELGQGNNGDRK